MEILPVEPSHAYACLGELTSDKVDRMALLLEAAIRNDDAADVLANLNRCSRDEARRASSRALIHINNFRGFKEAV